MKALIVLTLVGTLAIGVGAPLAAATPADPSGAHVSTHHKKKKKRKTVRCRENQVPVKVNRRTVGCRSLRAALPGPRERDTRLLLAKAALGDGLKLRDRRGRRAPSLKRLAHRLGPRAYRALQAAVPKGLERLGRLAATPATVSRAATAARALPRCASPSGPPRTDQFSSSSGGQKVTATLTLGAVGTLGLQLEGRGYTISVRITTDECSHFDAPAACPSAAGVIEATDESNFKVSLSVAKGDTVLMSRSFDYSGHTRMQAQVGDDAELKHIDIDDTQTANIELGGTGQQFGPINLIYTGIHHARVAMPAGNYVPDLSAIDISLTTRGVTVGRSDLGGAGDALAKNVDDGFADLVHREIDNFKGLEKGWKDPRRECVKLEFDPPSRTQTLRRGQRGSLSVQAVAAQGGGAAPGRWTLTGQHNASFRPGSAAATDARFSYEVTRDGRNVVVSATVHVTSRAGVGEATWEQETEDLPLYRGTISGTRGDAYIPGECGGGWQFSYSARLADSVGGDEPFPIIDPLVTEAGVGGAQGYDETGNGTYTLAPCHGLPGCSVNLSLDPEAESHGWVLFDADADTVSVSADVVAITYLGCGPSALTLGTGSFPRSLIGADTITVDLSFNSWPVFGNGTMTLTRVTP